MTDPTALEDNARVRRWTADQLAAFVGVPRGTMLRSFIAPMLADGVLSRPTGTRFWFGRPLEIARWFAGRFDARAVAPRGAR